MVSRLAAAEAWVAFRADLIADRAITISLSLTPLREEILSPIVHPVNRGFYSVIEATVHATRFVKTGDPRLGALIVHHIGLITRCGSPREHQARILLEEYLAKAPYPLPPREEVIR